MSFLQKLRSKYGIVAGPVIDIKTGKEIKPAKRSKTRPASVAIKGKPGDVFEVVEGANPHKGDKEETKIITVIGNDRHGDGFYYFNGNGKPVRLNGTVSHSNLFVWGVVSAKKIASHPFKVQKYKKYTWTHTGIPSVDSQMANLDGRYTLFQDQAPALAKNLYDKQEDKNYHAENGKLVDDFAGWVSSGKKADEFMLETKKTKARK